MCIYWFTTNGIMWASLLFFFGFMRCLNWALIWLRITGISTNANGFCISTYEPSVTYFDLIVSCVSHYFFIFIFLKSSMQYFNWVLICNCKYLKLVSMLNFISLIFLGICVCVCVIWVLNKFPTFSHDVFFILLTRPLKDCKPWGTLLI